MSVALAVVWLLGLAAAAPAVDATQHTRSATGTTNDEDAEPTAVGVGAVLSSTAVGQGLQVAVDELTGRVFVAGDDAVLAFDGDGTLLSSIPVSPDPSRVAAANGTVAVTAESGTEIIEIDAATLIERRRTTLPEGRLAPSLAVGTSHIWAVAKDDVQTWFVEVDVATGTSRRVVPVAPISSESLRFHAIPDGDDTALIAVDLVTGTVRLLDVTAAPTALVQWVGPRARDVDVTPDAVWLAFGLSTPTTRLSLPDLTPVTPTDQGGNGELLTVAHDRDLLVTKATTNLLRSYDHARGRAQVHELRLTDSASQDMADLEVTADGRRAYAIVRAQSSQVLITVDLTPRIDEATPSTVVTGVPTAVEVCGFGLGSLRSVTVAGLPATVDRATPQCATVVVPTTADAGIRTLALTTASGSAEVELEIRPNVGAPLIGTVGLDGSGLAGVELTLSGPSLSTPLTTTTTSDGGFTLGPLAYDTELELAVHDPAGRALDLTVHGVRAVPNETTELDLHVGPSAAPPDAGGAVAELVLPGTPSDVLVDGEILYVRVGHEVMALDLAGRPLRRRQHLPGDGGSLATVDGRLFLAPVGTAALVELDPATLAEVGRIELPTASNGQVAAAGGRLWLTFEEDRTIADSSWVHVVDPAAGTVERAMGSVFGNGGVAAVADDPDVLLAWADDGRIWSYDVTGPSPVTLEHARSSPFADAVGLAVHDRMWDSRGTTHGLRSELVGDQPSYSSGTTAASPTHGGRLAFGGTIFDAGDTEAIAAGPAPATGATAFTPDGRRLIVGTIDGGLVVWDVGPSLDADQPALPAGEARTLRLTGDNLHRAYAVAVNGQAVTFDHIASSLAGRALDLHVPAAVTEGVAEPAQIPVRVRTPEGTAEGTIEVTHRAPGPVRDLAAYGVSGTRLSWSPPSSAGTSPIDAYEYQVDHGPIRSTADTSAQLMTADEVPRPLPSGTYDITVWARSADGLSPPSTIQLTVELDPPARPNVSVGAGAGLATVAWVPVVGEGRAAITGYEVASEDLDERLVVPAERHEVVVHGLDPGVAVRWHVRALSEDGPSEWRTSDPVVPTAPVALFDDVPAGHPLYWEIWSAVRQGVTIGNGDGTFGPASPVTRQAAVTFLWRAAGSPTGPFPDPGFPDVGAEHPFATPVAWAAAEGITTGGVDGRFRPAAPVTRQAMIAFLWRAAGAPAGPFPDPGFTDVGPEHPFATPIAWAAAEGITTGNPNGTFAPTATVTRQAAVAFLVRPTWPDWQLVDDD